MADELTLEDLVKWHVVEARTALDSGRVAGTREARGMYMRLAAFHSNAPMLLERVIRERKKLTGGNGAG